MLVNSRKTQKMRKLRGEYSIAKWSRERLGTVELIKLGNVYSGMTGVIPAPKNCWSKV